MNYYHVVCFTNSSRMIICFQYTNANLNLIGKKRRSIVFNSINILFPTGLYRLTVENEAGSTTRYFRLTVNSAPDLTSPHDTNIIVDENEELRLEIDVDGKPAPDISWTKDGIEVVKEKKRFLSKTL